MKLCILALGLIGFLPSLTFTAHADNLHLVESRPGGFAIYRSGTPSSKDFQQWCHLGIQEVYILSGNGAEYEDKFAELCPSIKVIASEAHDVNLMPDERVLNLFDAWVEAAQRENKKILFRCNCGCHRTGRMAAYYQMKYQHLTADDAIAVMNAHGKFMPFHPELSEQVHQLEKYIKQKQSAPVSLAPSRLPAHSEISSANASTRGGESRLAH